MEADELVEHWTVLEDKQQLVAGQQVAPGAGPGVVEIQNATMGQRFARRLVWA